ncbi:DegT/DnrJ/EryC1/StrS family aminotransferase [Candidatus Azambacteria bacterium]|nr:DegT/DnrJ/EryC1/StrS family aminotransferase [Candidatus Azambacteria bacterium]
MSLAILGGSPKFKKTITKKSPIEKEEIKAATEVLKGGILSRAGRGNKVKEFEKEFASYFKVKHALATTSGTTALHTALASLDLPKDSEVMVPDLTFISSASVILQQGLKPVFIDIEKDTFCINVDDIEKKLTKKTMAIIVVHIYGNPADMKKIMHLAKKYNLRVIEDCAQAHGAKFNNKYVGTFGDLGCFSFYQTKNLSCGEGGMVITNNDSLYKKCVSISDHGLVDNNLQSYNYDRVGYNYHLTEIQAAIGIEQLKKLKSNNIFRKNNAKKYIKQFKGFDLIFQKTQNNSSSVFYTLTAILPEHIASQRDFFVDAVRMENAELNKIYPVPLHKTKVFSGKQKNQCPASTDITSRLFNFYTNPGITDQYINRACEAVKKVLMYLEQNNEKK